MTPNQITRLTTRIWRHTKRLVERIAILKRCAGYGWEEIKTMDFVVKYSGTFGSLKRACQKVMKKLKIKIDGRKYHVSPRMAERRCKEGIKTNLTEDEIERLSKFNEENNFVTNHRTLIRKLFVRFTLFNLEDFLVVIMRTSKPLLLRRALPPTSTFAMSETTPSLGGR